jgi:hypothetical protein
MSGRSGIILVIASNTQSVGVPSTEYRRSACFRARNGRVSVMEWAVALCSDAGATTVTSPIPSSAAANAAIPSEKYPSSLVTKILGFTAGKSLSSENADVDGIFAHRCDDGNPPAHGFRLSPVDLRKTGRRKPEPMRLFLEALIIRPVYAGTRNSSPPSPATITTNRADGRFDRCRLYCRFMVSLCVASCLPAAGLYRHLLLSDRAIG